MFGFLEDLGYAIAQVGDDLDTGMAVASSYFPTSSSSSKKVKLTADQKLKKQIDKFLEKIKEELVEKFDKLSDKQKEEIAKQLKQLHKEFSIENFADFEIPEEEEKKEDDQEESEQEEPELEEEKEEEKKVTPKTKPSNAGIRKKKTSK